MRILFLTNFYPPSRPGGYTQWCQEVALGLKARGHTIGILTSRHGIEKIPPGEKDIWRLLHLEGDLFYYRPLHFFTRWRQERKENLLNLERTVQIFAPDILFVWGMWAMSKELPALAERLLPAHVAYYISDYWPSAKDMHTQYWDMAARQWLMRLPKRIFSDIAQSLLAKNGVPELKFENAICVSAAVRDILLEAGLPLHKATIIHGGTDLERFQSIRERDFSARPLRLLYAGQLASHKGVHTAVRAMGMLVNSQAAEEATLTIVGSGHPEYEALLRNLVDRENLHDCVSFHGPVSKEEVPALLQRFDVMIFPSVYEEPLARMTQEAMLAGLFVVGTTTGGTKEILIDGNNGLTFTTEDAAGLARQIRRLIEDPALCLRLSQAGRQTALEKFTLTRMVDEIEAYLINVMEYSAGSKVEAL